MKPFVRDRAVISTMTPTATPATVMLLCRARRLMWRRARNSVKGAISRQCTRAGRRPGSGSRSAAGAGRSKSRQLHERARRLLFQEEAVPAVTHDFQFHFAHAPAEGRGQFREPDVDLLCFPDVHRVFDDERPVLVQEFLESSGAAPVSRAAPV